MSFNHHVAAQIPTGHSHRRVLAPADQRPQSSHQQLDQDEHKAPKQQLPKPALVSSSSRTGGNYICHWVNCGQGIETAEKLYVRQDAKIRLILPFPPLQYSLTSGLISSSNSKFRTMSAKSTLAANAPITWIWSVDGVTVRLKSSSGITSRRIFAFTSRWSRIGANFVGKLSNGHRIKRNMSRLMLKIRTWFVFPSGAIGRGPVTMLWIRRIVSGWPFSRNIYI